VTGTDDHWPDAAMLTDDAVDQLVEGTTTDPELARLAMFAHQVQFQGEQPPPAPSPELAALLRGEDVAPAAPAAPPAVVDSGRHRRPTLAVVPGGGLRRTVAAGWARTVAKVAGLGIAAKVALGATVAAAGVVTASAAGVMPEPVNDAVRHVIEAVTPFELDHDEPSGDRRDRDDADDQVPAGGSGSEAETVPEGSPTTAGLPDQPPPAPAPAEGATTATTGLTPPADTSTTTGTVAEEPSETGAEPTPDPAPAPAAPPTSPPSRPGGHGPPVTTGPGDHGPPIPVPTPPAPGPPSELPPPAQGRADPAAASGRS
jgi:hypothetical protein